MDFHLKQPMQKQQHQKVESEEEQHQQPSPAKFPRLNLQLESHPQHQQDSKPPLPAASRFPCRVGGYFSTDQWQELEVQALIFRHMVAGAAVPNELLQLVKKSLLNSSSFNLNNTTNFSYYHPALFQAAGSWSKGAMDPEPGRCRRTDGKKWRCSRDVVAGHKYCERHVHRGRNRSRKPVETAVPTTATTATLGRGSFVSGPDNAALGVGTHNHKSSAFGSAQQYAGLVGGGDGAHFSLSSPTSSSLDIVQLNQGASQPNPDGKFLFKSQNDTFRDGESKLRHFFDDWPKPDHTSIGGATPVDSATCLSISTPGVDPSVDFLKLSTGNGGDHLARKVDGEWSGGNQAASAGGPLAEAFRSSTGASTSDALHQLPQSASGTSCVAA